MTAALQFLEALWPLDIEPHERLVVSWQAPGATGVANEQAVSIEDAARWAEHHKGRHVWLNVATRREGTERRGSDADCVRIPALWADLDVADDKAHKGERTFATKADALAALDRLRPELRPSILVSTGYGLSAWWLLDEPAEVDAVRPLLAAIEATISRVTDGRADAVYDITRMMRLPGTLNVKDVQYPRPVTIEWLEERRFGLDDLSEWLDVPPVAQAPTVAPTLPRAPRTNAEGEVSPGDDYNAAMTTESVVELLQAHGATIAEQDTVDGRLVVRMTRPGKDVRAGLSLTVGYVAPAITHVFSSGWAELPAGTYDPFGVYGRLVHGGDFPAAANALAAEGFGSRIEPLGDLPELTGVHVAERFATWLGERAIYVAGMSWLTWDGRRYVRDEDGNRLRRMAMDYAKALAAGYREAIGQARDEDAEKAALKAYGRALGWLESGKLDAMMTLTAACPTVSVRAETLDCNPWALNVANGTIDLRSGELRAHDPAERHTRLADTEYRPGAVSDDWTKALSGLDESLRSYLQVALGMSCYGRSGADAVFVTMGSGGNGKSTTLGAVHAALGDYAVSVQAHVITEGSGARPQELMDLRGARFALVPETGEDHYLASERIKALSGGDPITDRYLYARSSVTWMPSHTFWLMTNHQPRIRDTTNGTWRRLKRIEYTASYVGAPDETLRDRLQADPANRAAVLSWLVQGAMAWNTTKRLPVCAVIEEGVMAWREEENVIAAFLTDCDYLLTDEATDTVGRDELYQAYRKWTSDQGLGTFAARKFTAELRAWAAMAGKRLEEGKVKGLRYWKGIRKASYIDIAENGGSAIISGETFAEDEEGFPW